MSGPARPDPPGRARVVLVTGKGGVGKSTLAGATAVNAARGGARVLLTSTDPAHSLGDLFGVELGDTPVAVDDRLDALQLDGRARLEEHWHEVRDWLVELLARGGLGDVQARELVMVPGLDELFALLDLHHRVSSGDHDVVVVDCAPTAETLRLLALPEALSFYVERLLGPGRRLARLVRPVRSSVAGVPIPDDEVFSSVDRVQRLLAEVRALLADPDRTSVRLVLAPERLVVAEGLRMATTLALFDHRIDAVLVNRVLDEDGSRATAAWRERQREHLDTIDEAFPDRPRLVVPHWPDEPVGIDALAAVGDRLYGDLDPTAVLARTRGMRVERIADRVDAHRLLVPVAFARTTDVRLHRRGRDLHVEVGAAKRVVALPDALAGHEVVGARVAEGYLEVDLHAPSHEVAS